MSFSSRPHSPLYFEGEAIERFGEILKREWVSGSIGYTVKPIYLCALSLTEHKTYGNSQYPFSWKDVENKHEYKEGLCPKSEDALKHLYTINLNECWTYKQVENTAEIIKNALKAMDIKTSAAQADKPVIKKMSSIKVSEGKKIKIGIIGCGLMGNMHLSAYKNNPDVEISAYCDTDIEKAKQKLIRVKANIYSSHKDMFANEKLDGVSVCTVPSSHREIVCDALDAGVNVLCEKPLAVSAQEAREMTDKASKKNKLLLTAFKFRFFEEVTHAKEILEKDQLGQIVHFRLMFGGQINMAGKWYAQKEISGGGIIMDNGPHAIDLIRYLLGEMKEVQANVSNYQDISLEDTAQINCKLANGAHGTIDISWSVPAPSSNYLEIYGMEGTMLLDFNGLSYKLKSWNDWKRLTNQLNSEQNFAKQIDHFIGAISGTQQMIIQNGDGLETQKIVEKSYDSIKFEDKALSGRS